MPDRENDNSFKPLPDIEQVKRAMGHGRPVSVPELNSIAKVVQSKTVLSKEVSNIIVALFFEEIRSSMLEGSRVVLRGFGSFQVSSPRTTGNRKKIFPKFQISNKLKERLNASRKSKRKNL